VKRNRIRILTGLLSLAVPLLLPPNEARAETVLGVRGGATFATLSIEDSYRVEY
jgi:hypothetical protein